MTRSHTLAGLTARTTTLACTLGAAGLLALGCAPSGDGGETPPDTTAATAEDTVPAGEMTEPAEGDTATGMDTMEAHHAPPGTVSADTGGRTWPRGGYMVYLREGVDPDSVAADHGIDSVSVESTLPGFYARLTAEEATALGRDERVEQMAKQIEEEAPPEPREIPTAGEADTASG